MKNYIGEQVRHPAKTLIMEPVTFDYKEIPLTFKKKRNKIFRLILKWSIRIISYLATLILIPLLGFYILNILGTVVSILSGVLFGILLAQIILLIWIFITMVTEWL